MAQYAANVATMRRHRSGTVVPRMSVVILVVGTRGDVQPFIPIAQRLAGSHRVRLATHAIFRPLVEDSGVEFYPLAGDPRELVEYMVRTGGRLVPTRLDHIVEDVPRKRTMIGEILESTWRACTEPDPEHPGATPFVAEWIIANPPSYGHIHCAEALDVPLHMVFTMPWTATGAFPHPMTSLRPGEHGPLRNFLSYGVASTLMWAGVSDVVNAFRETTLGLRPLDLAEGSAILDDAEVPFTYLFPESVVPRPADWGPHIDLANFVFWEQGASFEPPAELAAFLAAGDPPVYVGFGSSVVPDPAALTRVVFDGLARAGMRGVVSRGWGDLGTGAVPDHVHMIDDCPHDWLFPRCRIVCHHGGAGTTAAGLRAGLPTVVVPFFGDQFFWGQVVADAGAGPPAIPAGELTAEGLAEALQSCTRAEMRARARRLGARVRARDGVELVLASLRRHLPLHALQCAVDARHLASVFCEQCGLRLCQACVQARHAHHRVHPYRYVDWSARPPRTLSSAVRELIADAGGALRAGLDEMLPLAAPHRAGVVRGTREAATGRARPGTVWKAPRRKAD
jgi:UDP:flavonoid glycosyltransferase YjiC (YdhE family)